jgi:hypothetical protein
MKNLILFVLVRGYLIGSRRNAVASLVTRSLLYPKVVYSLPSYRVGFSLEKIVGASQSPLATY